MIAGRPLNLLLDEAIAAWAAGAWRKVANPCTSEVQRRVRRCLAESQGAEHDSLLRAQRLLIRRAGAGVPSMTLWLPPPPAFAPDYWRVSPLIDYTLAMNDWPRRGTSPTRYLPAAQTWRQRFEEIRQIAELAARPAKSCSALTATRNLFRTALPRLAFGREYSNPLRTVR